MNTVQTIAAELDVIRASHVVDFIHNVARGRQALKARIYLSGDLFVQIYRNDRFGTTSFALILGERRIYGRDERDSIWHRHPADDPDAHDDSDEGKREVTVGEFWTEALVVIDHLGLLF